MGAVCFGRTNPPPMQPASGHHLQLSNPKYDAFAVTCIERGGGVTVHSVLHFLPFITLSTFEVIGFSTTTHTAIPAFSRRQLLHVLEFVVFRALEASRCLGSCAALIRRHLPDVSDNDFHIVFANCFAYNSLPGAEELIADTIRTSCDVLLVACLLAGNDVTALSAVKRRFIIRVLQCGEELLVKRPALGSIADA
jgi:hypothetical protein